jgi:hypothetical protein
MGHSKIRMTGALCEGSAATRQHITETSSTAQEKWKLFERAAPKVEVRETDVRTLYAGEILTRLLAIDKLLKILVARDGIEPPTPAFSGPPTESPKWFEINGCC